MKSGREAEPKLLKIVENKEIEDNWQDYNYAETRYLDALASLYSVARPCAAISLSPDGKKHCLSYNENLDLLVKNKIAIIQNLLQDRTQQHFDNLLGFYLCFNVNFRPTLQAYNRIPKDNKTSKIKEFCKKISVFCKKIYDIKNELDDKLKDIKVITSKDIQNIKPKFVEISADYLTFLRSDPIELTIIPAICILRPYQDIIKLVRLNKLNLKNISTLGNSNEVHAELNIQDHAGYIGVSILCCYACDSGLKHQSIPHRGTDNLLFPDNDIYDNTDGTLISYNHERAIHGQQRRMSTDSEYEDQFLTSLKALYLSGETNTA